MVVIIDAKEAAEATPKILATHRIPHYKSNDLQAEHENVESSTEEAVAKEEKKEEQEEDEEDDFEEDHEESEVPITIHNHEIKMK